MNYFSMGDLLVYNTNAVAEGKNGTVFHNQAQINQYKRGIVA